MAITNNQRKKEMKRENILDIVGVYSHPPKEGESRPYQLSEEKEDFL